MHDREPDLTDVARGAADVLGSQSVGGFVETSVGCELPPAEYEVDVDRLPKEWGVLMAGVRGKSRWQRSGACSRLAVTRRCYLTEHTIRLRTLERHQ